MVRNEMNSDTKELGIVLITFITIIYVLLVIFISLLAKV